jgi:Pro-kumamolisin, activation domain/Bacterial Ig-like domain (group 3)
MKTTRIFILRSSLFVLATLFFLSTGKANAQSAADAQTADAQSSNAQAAATSVSSPIIKPVPRITQKIDESNLVTLHRSVYPLAKAGLDQGLVADSLPVSHMLLVLQRSAEQEAGLRSLMDGQQSKGSANYHAWLTPTQFAQQFGVASEDIQQVAGWLAGKGFTGIKVSNGGMFIQFDGTAGLVRTAFHTEIHSVMVNGQVHMANLTDPQIPAALAPVVAKIHSLHDFRAKSLMRLAKPQVVAQAIAAAKNTKPGFTANPCTPFGATTCIGVGPGDLATIYNIPSTVGGSPAGQGQTVALVADSNVTISDINQFGAAFGIPNLTNFSTNNVIVNGPDPGIQSPDDGEATLDVDMVGSVAPNANILLVVNAGTLTGNLALFSPTQGTDQSALYIVDNNLAPVMSESFGLCEFGADTLFYSTVWEQAAAQGISVFVSTGDSGSDSCDDGDIVATGNATQGQATLTVNGIASTPFNVAVGGTDFNDASSLSTYWNTSAGLTTAKSYIPEIPWNDSCAATATTGSLNTCANETPNPDGLDLAGGSGGQSNCGVQNFTTDECTGYPKPSWQAGTGVPADTVRDLPDVSLYASVNSPSNHFLVFCLADSGSQVPGPCNVTGTPAYNFSGVGGTSASSPAWAGILALIDQSELAAGRSGRQGNANYVLYKLAAAQATSPGTSACNSSSAIPNSGCTLNDITLGNNSVQCVAGAPSCSNQTASGFGVLVEPSTPSPFSDTTPGWTATAGYDLATGLGTPNVANLIFNWPTVTTNLKTASPTITASTPATLTTTGVTHGATATFTISVTSGSGTPTGDVSLIAEPPGFAQVGVGFGTLSNGTVTITTNTLPGDDTTGAGTAYPVIAHYAGDGTFGPADSAPFNVTVNRENSTTNETLFNIDYGTGLPTTTATTSVQYGAAYMMVVNVVGATAGATCNNTNPNSITQIPTVPCPTGTITLTANGQPLQDFIQTGANNTNVSSVGNLGFVEDLMISLSGGANSVIANYSGDNSYNPSTSASDAVTVAKGPTQTAVTLNGSATGTAATGATVSLVATVFTHNMVLCNGVAQGCARVSNGAGPTGTVQFFSGATALGSPVAVVPTAFNSSSQAASGTATLTTSFSTAGSPSITATYSGDTNYQACAATGSPSTPAPGCTVTALALTVSGSVGAATQLAFTAAGQPSTVAANTPISPAGPVQVAIEDANGNIVAAATNQVTIAIGTNPGGGTIGGTVTATAVKGIATFNNLTISAPGTGYTLVASASGLTSATSLLFNVTAQPVKLAFTVPPSSINAGASINPAVAVSIEDANGNVVTGANANITVAIGTNPGSGTLSGPATTLATTNGTGTATFPNLTISAAGTGYTLTASAAGLTGATSPAFNVLATAAKLAFTVQPSNSLSGQSIAPAVQVAIQDSNGNIITSANTPITIAIGANPASGTLAGATTVTPFNGVATFSNLSVSTAGTGYMLTASAAGLTSATSAAFNVTTPTTPEFSLASTPMTLMSESGSAAGSSTITVTPSGGFTGTVTVTATAASLPPGVTCSNSPLAIDVTGVTAVTGTLTCQVLATSSTQSAFNAPDRRERILDAKAIPPTATDSTRPTGGSASAKGWWTLSASTGLAAIFFIFLPGGRKRLHAALGLGLVCLLGFALGCGGVGGGGGTGTTPTTTAIMVTNGTAGRIASGTAFTFTATVTATGATPTGNVQLFDNGAAIGTAVAVSSGTASLSAPSTLAVGTHQISAHYAGDSKTAASQSGTLDLTVTGSTTIAITTSPAATPAASPITLTVQ